MGLFSKSMDERRFQVVFSEGLNPMAYHVSAVICDKETGVQYLFYGIGNDGSITPLLNPDGSLRLYKEEEDR